MGYEIRTATVFQNKGNDSLMPVVFTRMEDVPTYFERVLDTGSDVSSLAGCRFDMCLLLQPKEGAEE